MKFASSKTSGQERIKVFVRARPLDEEKERKVVRMSPSTGEAELKGRSKDAPAKCFRFDGVFGSSSSQKEVYEQVVAPFVSEAIDGYNCTIFAYGQTGTGKTFTMEGGLEGGAAWSADHAQSGMIPRSVYNIFRILEEKNFAEYSVRVSHMEFYNEEIIDLLGSSESKPLRLFEHPKQGVTVHNLECVPVTSSDAIFKILRKSTQKRLTCETLMNATSSRSHCIFSITVSTKENTKTGEEIIRSGTLHLVDLAGSEGVAKSGDINRRETGLINQSLLTLGRVIMAVSCSQTHVPFRESKLTRFLTESLGGRNKTRMIATISMGSDSVDETLKTMEYAYKAKAIKNRPQMNSTRTKKELIKDYIQEIEKLKFQVSAAREKNGVYMPAEEFAAMETSIKDDAKKIADLEKRLAAAEEKVEDYSALLETSNTKLKNTSNTLEATAQELKDTKELLSSTQTVLAETKEALEEETEITRHKSVVEKVLHENARTILSTLGVREGEVEALHAKIEHKSDLEEENTKLSVAFREYVADKVSEMNEQLVKFCDAQVGQYGELKGSVFDFMKQKNTEVESLCEKLDSLQAMLVDSGNEFSQAMREMSDKSKSGISSLNSHSDETSKAVKEAVASYVSSMSAVVEQWKASLATQRENVIDWSINTAELVQNANDANEEWTKQHLKTAADLSATLSSNTEAARKWTEAHSRSIQDALDEHKSRTEGMQQVMFRQIMELVDEFVSTQNTTAENNFNMMRDSLSACSDTVSSQYQDAQDTISETLVAAVVARNQQVEEELEAMQGVLDDKMRLDEERIAADAGETDSWASRIQDFNTQGGEIQNSAREVLAEAAESVSWKKKEYMASFGDLSDKGTLETTSWKEEATNLALITRSSVDDFKHQHEIEIASHMQQTAAWGEKMQSDMNGLADQIATYFSSRKEDLPTGQTPVRRKIPHPVDLPRTGDVEEIVEKFWVGQERTQVGEAVTVEKKEEAQKPEEAVDHFDDVQVEKAKGKENRGSKQQMIEKRRRAEKVALERKAAVRDRRNQKIVKMKSQKSRRERAREDLQRLKAERARK